MAAEEYSLKNILTNPRPRTYCEQKGGCGMAFYVYIVTNKRNGTRFEEVYDLIPEKDVHQAEVLGAQVFFALAHRHLQYVSYGRGRLIGRRPARS